MHDGADERTRYNEPWRLNMSDEFEKGITYLCCLTCVLCQWMTITDSRKDLEYLFPDLGRMLEYAAKAASTDHAGC